MLNVRASDDQGAVLVGIGTAVPPHVCRQTDVARWLGAVTEQQPGHTPRLASLLKTMAAKSGVEQRHCILPDYRSADPSTFGFYPPNWSLDPFPTTADRMAVYRREAVPLAARAASAALVDAGIDAAAVTHLLVTTCTGFYAPGPDIELIEVLGLSPTVERTLVGFMGCYAGISAMRLADRIVRSDPDAVVLQVSVELCSLHFQREPTVPMLVANLLFGDGASAAVYQRTKYGRAALVGTRSEVSPKTTDEMRWEIGDHGFIMHLDARIPRTIRKQARPFVEALLAATKGEAGRLGWAIHPGGRRIVEAVASALDLSLVDVTSSFDVLRDVGNLSSATILFVLDRELARRAAGDRVVTIGFGPGLTIEGVVLDVR